MLPIFAVFYFLYAALELSLDLLNLRQTQKRSTIIPQPFSLAFSTDEYAKSAAYTCAKVRFHMAQLLYSAVVVWALILSGAFGWIAERIESPLLYPVAIGLLFYGLNLPFSVYHQFRLEARFGFNKTTPKTFVSDQVKTILIALALGLPLLALLFWLVESAGDTWWLWGWGSFMLFQLFTAAIFPTLLAPLFYKFTPLSDGPLKDELHALAKRLHFKMAGIYTIDGSKRSSHSNAFFAGLGKSRRIVLFDTLVKGHSQSEIIAIIAHEMGHNIRRHIQRSLLLSSLVTLAGFWLLAQCLNWPAFYHAFGVQNPSIQAGFVLFALFAPVFTFWMNPLFKHFSRKHEYEADAFAVETVGGSTDLKSALIALSKNNLANLTPHPWYSFYHYTHPTILERLSALERPGKNHAKLAPH